MDWLLPLAFVLTALIFTDWVSAGRLRSALQRKQAAKPADPSDATPLA